MSLLFLDSFDHYTNLNDKWDAQFFGSNIVATQAAGRFVDGALSIKGSGGGGWRDKSLPNSVELIAGFAWNNTAGDSFDGIFKFVDNFSAESLFATLVIDTSSGVGTLTYNGNTATTSTGVFTGSVWQHVEMRVLMSDTVGVLQIRRNGVEVASVTGIDTRPASVTHFTAFRVEADSNSQNHHMDDLYIVDALTANNNTYLGDSRITVLRPKDDGLVNNFLPVGEANNWETVDELLNDGDTTYVEAGAELAREAYQNKTFTDVGVTPGVIFGVQVVNAAKKTDAGRLDYLDQMIINGTTYDNGVDIISTSGTYKMTRFIRDTDPSDDATWTEAKVDITGSGLEITFREE